MRITVAKSAGFCSGVKRAIAVALRTAASQTRVEMLGDIVHNENVMADLEKAGIRKVRRLSSGRGKILLIRAHGAARRTIERARLLGYRVADATCPMVKEIHRIAVEMEGKGYRIIIIGDRRHEEVLGIVGQLRRRAVIVDPKGPFPEAAVRRFRRAAVVVQSTQDFESVLRIVERIRGHVDNVRFFNTICRPTRTKQEEIRRMPVEQDVVVVIGSRSSANTRRLFEISRSLNRRTHWVASERELRPSWFRGAARVGVTAGASTPERTMAAVIERIRAIHAMRT